MIQNFPAKTLKAFNKSFSKTFKVWSPSVKQHQLTLKYACPLRGPNHAPSVMWSGIPKDTTHLFLALIDGMCTWGCNQQGKAVHWVLNFPLSAMAQKGPFTHNGIKENMANNQLIKKFTGLNAMGKHNYLGPCAPVGQPHAWVFQLTAYKMNHGHKTILGITQSTPFLFPHKEL